jgi:hypothetical protein
MEFEQVHQACMHTYHTTAHQGLLKEQFTPPIPLEVLGETKGRLYTPDELARKFVQVLFPRTTNHYGCVTLQAASGKFESERLCADKRVSPCCNVG